MGLNVNARPSSGCGSNWIGSRLRVYPRHFNVLGFAGAVILHGLCAAALLAHVHEGRPLPAMPGDGEGAILVSLVSDAPVSTAKTPSAAGSPPTIVADHPEAALVEKTAPLSQGGERREAATDGEAVDGLPAASIDAAMGSDYRARLLAHIQPYRRYPTQAQRLDARGVAQILFMVDQNGKVTGVWVKASSGFEALDNEAVATVLRAQPMPHVPAGLPSPLAVQLPVSFNPS
jgi:protein TonB